MSTIKELNLGEHNKYKSNPLNSIIAYFKTDSFRDRVTLNQLFESVFEEKLNDFKVKDLFQSAQELAEIIELRTNGIKKCQVKIDKGEDGIDSAALFFNIEKKPIYFNYDQYGYITRKNQLNYYVKFAKFNESGPERFRKIMDDFQKAEILKNVKIGNSFAFDKWATHKYVTFEFQPIEKRIFGREINNMIKIGKKNMPILQSGISPVV